MERSCENVVVSNCVVSTHCNAIKMGTESHGGFKNITISNCAFIRPALPGFTSKTCRLIRHCLMAVDGAQLDCVTINNLSIQGMTHYFHPVGHRGRIFAEGLPNLQSARCGT